MSQLTKQLAGAYDSVECPEINTKYCEDNTIGQQPMLDFFNNVLSPDTPIINDVSDGLTIGAELRVVGDVNEEIGMAIITEIKNLFIRYRKK